MVAIISPLSADKGHSNDTEEFEMKKARKKRVKPTSCVVCHKMSIYADAAQNHPYGAVWEGCCYQCGANQIECAWVAQLYTLPLDTAITLRCDRWHAETRAGCKAVHELTLNDVLLLHVGVTGNGPHSWLLPYANFRGGCPVCGHFITGEKLMQHDLSSLRHLVQEPDEIASNN